MYHADQGAAFAAQALTGLHAGAGLPAVDPGASPADEAARGGGFVPETEGNAEEEPQGATQDTQGFAPTAAQPAVQPYKTGEEMSMAIHQDLGFKNGTATYSDMEIVQRLTDRLPIAERLAVTPMALVMGDEQPRVLELARRVVASFTQFDQASEDERGEDDVGLGGDPYPTRYLPQHPRCRPIQVPRVQVQPGLEHPRCSVLDGIASTGVPTVLGAHGARYPRCSVLEGMKVTGQNRDPKAPKWSKRGLKLLKNNFQSNNRCCFI